MEKEKLKKIMKFVLWLIVLLFVITLSLFISDHRAKLKREENIIIYDGSENNPYIEGVQ